MINGLARRADPAARGDGQCIQFKSAPNYEYSPSRTTSLIRGMGNMQRLGKGRAGGTAGRVSRGGSITGGIIPWDASAGASSQS